MLGVISREIEFLMAPMYEPRILRIAYELCQKSTKPYIYLDDISVLAPNTELVIV
jgi:hypothetical protein